MTTSNIQQPTSNVQCPPMYDDKNPIQPGDFFEIGNARYEVDGFGIIHQVPPFIMQQYDVGYVSERYDTIPDSVLNLSYLRAGFLLASCANVMKVLDIGYGNGGFLRAMRKCGAQCAGSDVSGYPLPDDCRFVPPSDVGNEWWNLVTFFDSLEHFETLSILGKLRADNIAITAPCVREDATVEWLAGWKHLRPGEHLHHFKPSALIRLMATHGYRLTTWGSPEDIIRVASLPDQVNTFTAVFHREQN